ncbi:MAG: twin-arginine translocation signal domain-containing protein [Terriglobia bacterium]
MNKPRNKSTEGSLFNPSRRDFLKGVSAAAVAGGIPIGLGSLAVPEASGARPQLNNNKEKFVGIQIGGVSFTDEGVDKVLDILQERAGVNALMLVTFAYGREVAGRQLPNQPLPDHGVQQYDTNTFHGGNYAEVHPEFYRDTAFHDLRAPDLGKFDILGDVIPKAKARKIKSYCWFIDDINPRYLDGFAQMAAEVDAYGRTTRRTCLNNPHVRELLVSLVEDWIKSYDVDGIMWGSERQGPLNNAIERPAMGGFGGGAQLVCFCPYCRKKGKERGIDVERAREGFKTLEQWVETVRGGHRPADGYFVTFWRVLANYPEIVAWEKLWTDNQHEVYGLLYGEVKSARPEIPIGWHLWHNNSFSPFCRAELDYRRFVGVSDFLKVVMYNNCAGPRLARYIDNVHSTVFGDLSPEEVLNVDYKFLGYKGEKSLNEIPQTGLSATYVAEETKRALADVQERVPIYSGIDVDVPTGQNEKKTTPEDVRNAVRAALTTGAQGVILSRKYSEMWLDHLGGAGQALKDLGIWKG